MSDQKETKIIEIDKRYTGKFVEGVRNINKLLACSMAIIVLPPPVGTQMIPLRL